MAIQSIGNMQKLFNQGDMKTWSSTNKGPEEWGANKNLSSIDGLSLEKMGMLEAPISPSEIADKPQSFGEFLTSAISQTNKVQVEANNAIEELVSGKSKNIQETLLKVEEADLAYKMLNQVRTKVLDAYKEIMKMQI